MWRLNNPIQPYAWGSRTAIAHLQNRPPGDSPEAELWMGAHPNAPSRLADGRTLGELIEQQPALLGPRGDRFQFELPFLFKVLAAAEPLSIQCHPSPEQAVAGFEKENAAGIALDAPHRNYRDPRAKPELIVALEPFTAMLGFRERSTVATLELGDRFTSLIAPLKTEADDAWATCFARLMTMSQSQQAALVKEVLHHHDALATLVATWVKTLFNKHGAEAGVLAPILLELYELKAGEGLYLGPGELHAYLQGTGVELMANSNNVLRGGLTKKHVDVPELLSVLTPREGRRTPLTGTATANNVVRYETPAPEFRLHRLQVSGSCHLPAEDQASPYILLVTEGEVVCRSQSEAESLRRGESLFVGAQANWQLEGDGVVYAAGVNLHCS